MEAQSRVELPKATQLLASAANPCMDLVALVCLDNALPLAAAGPPGLTPAQIAMRQRMLAFQARRLGVANSAAASSGANIKHGASVKLVLMRTGAGLGDVWEVAVTPPQHLFSTTNEDEMECVCVADICWSPDGERLALRMYVTRQAGASCRYASALLSYSVYNGDVVSTTILPCGSHANTQGCSMAWIPATCDPAPSQALDILRKLTPLPSVEDLVQATSGAHKIMRPLHAMYKQGASAPSPSTHIHGDAGAFTSIPALPYSAQALGFVVGSGPDIDAERGGTVPSIAPRSSLVVLDGQGTLHVLLDGTVSLGSIQLAQASHGACLLGASMHTAWVLLDYGNKCELGYVSLLPSDEPCEGPSLVAVQQLSQLSTALCQQLACAMDAVHYAAQAWTTLSRPRAQEWSEKLEDAGKRHAVDITLELMSTVMTSRAGPATEHLLLQVTEGMTIAMEQDAKHGLKLVRRYVGTILLPACERMLVLLTELGGCALWPERFETLLPPSSTNTIEHLITAIQTCHTIGLALQEESERELLALDEFFKWWRMEQDRQERLKVEEVSPSMITSHDTLTVLEFLRRGFISPALDALLGAPATHQAPLDEDTSMEGAHVPPPEPAPVTFQGTPRDTQKPTLQATLADTRAWLADGRPPLGPTEKERIEGIYAAQCLFAGPAHLYPGPRALPGDAQLLQARLTNIRAQLAALLSEALARTMQFSTHEQFGMHTLPDTVHRRVEGVWSMPQEMEWDKGHATLLVRTIATQHLRQAVLYSAPETLHVLRLNSRGIDWRDVHIPPLDASHVALSDLAWADADNVLVLGTVARPFLGYLAVEKTHIGNVTQRTV
ncbi:hypothetical protein MVES_001797 [Malassezia vespertilionis]|uniref:Anaphase-promoting complex subunit 4 n=1 Tax=Malassezia vespertilionis TaxID=2020962 RepID=A0A2N1JDP1_9BASI|nr:hypothetical protein MVES_001797 [Malassezia vespertilionis]